MGAPKGKARPDMIDNKLAVGHGYGAPEIYTQDWLENEAAELLKWFEVPRNIWLKGFALLRGYDPSRYDEFAAKSNVFSLALKKAKELQEFKLVDKGLFNEINANITKFTLANNHGWAERSTVTHKGKTLGDEMLDEAKGDDDNKP